MKNKNHKKIIVIGIIIILTCSTIIPSISSKKINPENKTNIKDEIPNIEDEIATITLNTFNENGKKENQIELPTNQAKYIFNLFNKLKNKTIEKPNSQETQNLKNQFIELLVENDLIPRGMTKTDIQPLINPYGSPKNQKTRTKTGLLGLIFELLFNNKQKLLKIIEPLDYPSEWNIVCNIAGGGSGIVLPFFIIPRPRAITVWGAAAASTATGSLLTGKSYVAIGNQQGICLGFTGIGLTLVFAGFMFYAILGYALFTSVQAQEIERYNIIPTITNEKPTHGSTNIPTTLNELSFRIADGDGDSMSYTVTTSPNIGTGSGNGVSDGTYTVPVSNLDSDTEYKWYVTVNDGYDTVEKTFTFKTEKEAPIISNPNPTDGEIDVSVNLSELSFDLKDYQGDQMDYTVTTDPDIGTGSGNGVSDGTYTVPVSGLDYLTEYKWHVTVTDGEHQTNKIYNFKTTPIMIFDPYDMGWQYRKKITIDHTKVNGNLENFPVLISLTDNDLRDKAQNDGDDILFMDGPGTANRRYHEIEYYQDTNGELIAWVNIPNLSSSEDTVIYMYYGNNGCNSQDYPERVWDPDYVAVYHLGGSSYIDIEDSTFNNLDVNGELGNPSYQENGKIGFCVDFDDDSLNIADDDLLSFTNGSNDKPMTIESWVNCDITGGDLNPIVAKWGNNKREWQFRKNPNDDQVLFYLYDEYSDSSIFRKTESSLNVDNTGWNYIAGSYNGDETGYDISFILDGEVEKGDQHTGSFYNGMKNLAEPMRIGAYYSTNENKWYYWQGLIDEVRISKTARSSSWLITSFNTMNDPSSFFNVGPEE